MMTTRSEAVLEFFFGCAKLHSDVSQDSRLWEADTGAAQPTVNCELQQRFLNNLTKVNLTVIHDFAFFFIVTITNLFDF